MTEPTVTVTGVYRYPVKGLSPEALDRVHLEPGQTLPFDRAYAIENGPGRFDPAHPAHLPKINFLMLMRDERLATLETRFDDATQTLTIHRQGRQIVRGDLRTVVGRQLIEQFMAAYMAGSLRGAPKIVSAPGHSFSDVSTKCVHIVNLATVRDVERSAGRPLNPLRFRANIYIDGAQPWSEFGWIGKGLSVGGARLQAFDRTSRCDATSVDPETGVRDISVPTALQRTWGHSDLGVYATVTSAGTVSVGDTVTLS